MTNEQFISLIIIYFCIAFIVFSCTYAYYYKKYYVSSSRYTFSSWLSYEDYDSALFLIPLFWPFVLIIFIIYLPFKLVTKTIRKLIENTSPNKKKYDW